MTDEQRRAEEQADISKWYMNTNKKMSYMME